MSIGDKSGTATVEYLLADFDQACRALNGLVIRCGAREPRPTITLDAVTFEAVRARLRATVPRELGSADAFEYGGVKIRRSAERPR